ncbi:MAG: hypothetical protein RMJ43_14115 [Chloroherpetonaceae bacterium]|nr:hypothetical protein [Chthonomonadaceae bacterium]MDW8208965.1 hypothetical protein [Chloroherpetonaceae bacterium]
MKRLRALVTFGLVVGLYGCGGGGGTVQSTGSQDPLGRGRAQLERVASGAQEATVHTFESIWQLFDEALRGAPGDAFAHFGAAVCLSGVVALQAEGSGVGGGGLWPGGFPGEVPPAPPGVVVAPASMAPWPVLGLIWHLDQGLANPLSLLHMLAPVVDLRYGLIPFYGYAQDDVARRQQLLEKLNQAVAHLAQVEAKPDFVCTLPDRDGVPMTLTLAEVYLFDACVQSLRVAVALSLAYVRDVGEAPPPPPIFTMHGREGGLGLGVPVRFVDLNRDGQLSPGEYLPPSPFLTLRDAAYLRTAQEALLAVADRAGKGVTLALARAGDQRFLIPNTEESRALLQRLRDDVVPLIQQAASGPVTLEWEVPTGPQVLARASGPRYRPQGNVLFAPPVWPVEPPLELPAPRRQTLTINLVAWFANPPVDLKAFAPTYPLDAQGEPRIDQAIYPDPRFGGLFPEGLPGDFWF